MSRYWSGSHLLCYPIAAWLAIIFSDHSLRFKDNCPLIRWKYFFLYMKTALEIIMQQTKPENQLYASLPRLAIPAAGNDAKWQLPRRKHDSAKDLSFTKTAWLLHIIQWHSKILHQKELLTQEVCALVTGKSNRLSGSGKFFEKGVRRYPNQYKMKWWEISNSLEWLL